MSVRDTVVAIRRKYGSWEDTLEDGSPNPAYHWPTREELGAILNEVAWLHRAEGWGVNAKPAGFNVPQPTTGRLIASDILHHQPTNIIYDVLISAGERAEPCWNEVGQMTDPGRPWVPPVHPAGGQVPDPDPPQPDPPTDLTPVMDALADLHERLVAIETVLQAIAEAAPGSQPWPVALKGKVLGFAATFTGQVGPK